MGVTQWQPFVPPPKLVTVLGVVLVVSAAAAAQAASADVGCGTPGGRGGGCGGGTGRAHLVSHLKVWQPTPVVLVLVLRFQVVFVFPK